MQENDPIKEQNSEQTADTRVEIRPVDDLTILRNLLEPKQPSLPTGRLERPSDQGREVSLADAFSCIERFAPAMREHGIVDDMSSEVILDDVSTETKSNIKGLKKRRITESEEFGGPNLLEWMVKVVKRYDPDGQGTNMVIRLMLGIYTDKFLNDHLSNNDDINNEELRNHKKDRITIFLVPFYYDANGEQRELVDTEQEELKGGGPTAYDLGGLQP